MRTFFILFTVLMFVFCLHVAMAAIFLKLFSLLVASIVFSWSNVAIIALITFCAKLFFFTDWEKVADAL